MAAFIIIPQGKSLLETSPTSCRLPQFASLQQKWKIAPVSDFWNGFKWPVSRASMYFLNSTVPGKHRDVGIVCAASSGQADPVVSIQFDDEANVTAVPFDENKLKLTVSVTSKGTEKALNAVLKSLSQSAPPVNGFRKAKGGKSRVPKNVLYQMLGPSRVDRFVIEETVTSIILDYLQKEDIKAKKEFKTIQSNNELAAAFKAGHEFGFDAILELEETTEPALIPVLDNADQ